MLKPNSGEDTFQVAIETVASLRCQMSGIQSTVELLKSHSSHIVSRYIDIQKRLHQVIEEHEINIRTGWWYPSKVVAELPEEVVHIALSNEETSKAFSKLIVSQCNKNDKQFIREMGERWQKYDFIPKTRKNILTDVIDSHTRREYSLSIPVAMAQTEYFFLKAFPRSNERSVQIKGNSLDNINEAHQVNFARQFGITRHGDIPASVYYELYPVYYYFKNIIFANKSMRNLQKSQNVDLYRLSSSNNRNIILHGESSMYASERRSVKQLLFLDRVLEIMEKIHKKESF